MRARRLVQGALEPWRGTRRVPASRAATLFESHFRLIGRVVFQQSLQLLNCLAGIDQRRQPQRQLEGGVGTQHVARILERGKAFGPGDGKRRFPRPVKQRLDRVGGGWQGEGGGAAAVVVGPRKALVEFVSQDRRRGVGLHQAVSRYFAMETGRQQPAGGAVFKPVEHLSHDAETRWHQTRCVARVNALCEDFHFEGAARHAAQRGREPQLVVVAGARIQADHQADFAEPVFQCRHVGQQIVGAAFFAGFNQADDAGMGHALRLQGLHRRNAGVDRVAVVGTAASVQQAILVLGRPGAEVVAPAGELWLLVEMAVHQHGVGHGRTGGRHFEEQHRRTPFESNDFQCEAFYLLRFGPGGGVAQHGFQMAMGCPLGIKTRRLRGNGDVLGKLPDDVVVPLGCDLTQGTPGIKETIRHFAVQGCIHQRFSAGESRRIDAFCAPRRAAVLHRPEDDWLRTGVSQRASGSQAAACSSDLLTSGAAVPNVISPDN